MRKYLTTFMMLAFLAGLMLVLMPESASAQRKQYARRYVDRNGHVYYRRSAKPSLYRRHRNRINVAGGTVGGAILGGLIGGKKGALIGAGAGAGSSALYTYKIRPKKKKYIRIRRP